MNRTFLLACLLLGVLALAPGSALGHGRLAIVIGNTAYESGRYERLPNAVADAKRLSEALERLDFEVLTGLDLTADGFEAMLADAEARLGRHDAVVIFYAGHGVELGGETYLLPVDTPDPDSVGSLTSHAARLGDVIARFAGRDRPTLAFIDACRNDPLDPRGDRGHDPARGEAGENVLVAFATRPGGVTYDGAGAGSPFATALLRHIETPGLGVSPMMARVRAETEALTAGRQVPWMRSSLRARFHFAGERPPRGVWAIRAAATADAATARRNR